MVLSDNGEAFDGALETMERLLDSALCYGPGRRPALRVLYGLYGQRLALHVTRKLLKSNSSSSTSFFPSLAFDSCI
jgi:hypothetical protein